MSERVPRLLRSKHSASFNVLDPFGHVSTQHYLTFFLEHRWVAFREQLGVTLASLARLPFMFVVRKATIEYLQPVLGDDSFEITSRVVRAGEVDFTVLCELRKDGGKLAATCELVLVTLSKETRRPAPPTPEFLDMLYER
jgi:YbgC/YbaW family acyl-CoA thioester hydrolase